MKNWIVEPAAMTLDYQNVFLQDMLSTMLACLFLQGVWPNTALSKGIRFLQRSQRTVGRIKSEAGEEEILAHSSRCTRDTAGVSALKGWLHYSPCLRKKELSLEHNFWSRVLFVGEWLLSWLL